MEQKKYTERQKRPRINPEALADAIRTGIQTGAFAPKQRLVEIDLISRYSVSRSCVRSALRILEAEGLIQIVKSQGAFVRQVTREEVTHTLDVLDALANFAVQQAAERISERRVKKVIKKSLADTQNFLKNNNNTTPMTMYLTENNRFWSSLMDSVGNPVLKKTHASLQALLHRILLSGLQMSESRDQWLLEHVEILEAILAGNADEAERLTIKSSRRSQQDLSSLPDSAYG